MEIAINNAPRKIANGKMSRERPRDILAQLARLPSQNFRNSILEKTSSRN